METLSEISPIVIEREQPTFVRTGYVKDILKWAFIYLNSGYPIHLHGPAGTGKTTLGMYIAAQLGRPVILIHGDEEFGTSDLVGRENGYRSKKVVDNFIHSVLKAEEQVTKGWIDDRLTVACKYGFTLLYDEFTRSRPEANNVLLPVLEEEILDLPSRRGGENHMRVHPEFRAIFTSNSEEYAGVHKFQDALKDRMIAIQLGHYDRDTEAAITRAKSGTSQKDAEKIVDIVRDYRGSIGSNSHPTVRACCMIARVMNQCGAKAVSGDENFVRICVDILKADVVSGNGKEGKIFEENIRKIISKHC